MLRFIPMERFLLLSCHESMLRKSPALLIK